MIDICKLLVILYAILLVPYMAGVLWHTYVIKKEIKYGYFLKGWFVMMALFFLEALPMVMRKRPLRELKYAWIVTMILITIVFLLCVIMNRKQWKPDRAEIIKKCRLSWIPGIMILYSVVLVSPQIEDDTTEVVMTAYMTDTMYQYQPYTGEAYTELQQDRSISPIEMYYAVLVDIVKMHPSIVVKRMIPIGFLPVAMQVYFLWGEKLFTERKYQKIFLFLVACVYFVPTIIGDMSVLAVWRNCWRGETLMATIALPMVGYYVYDMMCKSNETYDKKKYLILGINLLPIAIAAQLFFARGFLYSVIIVLAGIFVTVIRRCWEFYAANTNHY